MEKVSNLFFGWCHFRQQYQYYQLIYTLFPVIPITLQFHILCRALLLQWYEGSVAGTLILLTISKIILSCSNLIQIYIKRLSRKQEVLT